MTVKLIVFKNGKVSLNFATICTFLSNCKPVALGTGRVSFLMKHSLKCFGFYLMRV